MITGVQRRPTTPPSVITTDCSRYPVSWAQLVKRVVSCRTLHHVELSFGATSSVNLEPMGSGNPFLRLLAAPGGQVTLVPQRLTTWGRHLGPLGVGRIPCRKTVARNAAETTLVAKLSLQAGASDLVCQPVTQVSPSTSQVEGRFPPGSSSVDQQHRPWSSFHLRPSNTKIPSTEDPRLPSRRSARLLRFAQGGVFYLCGDCSGGPYPGARRLHHASARIAFRLGRVAWKPPTTTKPEGGPRPPGGGRRRGRGREWCFVPPPPSSTSASVQALQQMLADGSGLERVAIEN